MDPSFFGLDGHPFESSSQREEAYLADTHASLIAELRAGLKAPHGITLLIGEEGTGKTKLIRQFAEELADGCTVAYLPTTGPGLRHLLTEIIEQLGGSPPAAGDEQALLQTLASLARARAQHGRTTLVVVDDAHELPAKTIERIGRLFGEDPADPSMLHVVLVGRPELLDRMNAANDRSILKHLVQVCRMDPIGPEESFRYIADRVAKVGGVVDQLFTQDALRLIVKKANGNPGRIDAICTAALHQAAEIGEHAVGADTVDLACMGVEGFSTEGSRKRDGGDPMQYIFGDEEEEHGGSNVQQRLRNTGSPKESGNGKVKTEQPARSRPASSLGSLAPLVARVKEQFAGLEDSRRRLVVWAVGLVVVLIGFAALTTRSGDRGTIKLEDAAKVASASKKKTLPEEAATSPSAEEAAPQPLATDAVRTSKLVVNRDGSASAGQVVPADAATAKPSVAASPAEAQPSAVAVKVDERPSDDRPHIQAPAYTAPAPTNSPAANTAPTNAPGVTTIPAPPAPGTAKPSAVQNPPAPKQVAAAQPAAVATEKPAVTTQPKPAGTAAAAAPKPVSAAPAAAQPAPVTQPAPAAKPVAKPETTKLASASQSSAQPASGGRFTVQVGAFKSRENADALVARLQKSYPDARVLAPEGSGASTVFRVVSGAFPSRADAESRARTLGTSGYTAYVRDMPR